jgi:hypothetical protein
MYNFGAYALAGNTWGQNPAGVGGANATFLGTLVAERLVGSRESPWLTVGGNVSGGYLEYASVSPPTLPPLSSTSLTGAGTGSAVVNATLGLLYSGKTPQFNLWGEAYGSYLSGTPYTPHGGGSLPSGRIVVVGGSLGATANIPLGRGGLNVLSVGAFLGARREWDWVGTSLTTSTSLYIGGGGGFARRF